MLRTLAEMRPWHKLLLAALMAVVLALAAAFTVVAQSQVQQAKLRGDLERAGRLASRPDPALAYIGGRSEQPVAMTRSTHTAPGNPEAGLLRVGAAVTASAR